MSNLMNWIRGRYYKFKYRTKDGAAVGIMFRDESKNTKNEFHDKLDEISKKIKPCPKTIAQLQEYIVEKYNAKAVPMSDGRLEHFKVGLILNFYPDVLNTPQIQTRDKVPKRAEFLKWHENNVIRMEEARKYPIEKLYLVVSHYTFDYICENGKKVVFQIDMEEKTEQCAISTNSTSIDGELDEVEKRTIRRITHDIDLYKGVTQDDIDTRTPRFLGYASTLMEINDEKK